MHVKDDGANTELFLCTVPEILSAHPELQLNLVLQFQLPITTKEGDG